MDLPSTCDVLVVGSGNAGFSAAVAAAEAGAPRVVLIDKCPESWAGGNSYFTAGAYRIAHGGLSDILPLVSGVSADEAARIDLAPYTEADFAADMASVCAGRSDPALSKALVEESGAAIRWLAGNGVRFCLSFNRQAYEVDGRLKFWGGLCLRTPGGGKSLVEDHRRIASERGVQVRWSTALRDIRRGGPDDRGLVAVVSADGAERSISAGAVIFAAGGFEANPRLRSQYLGPGWDMAYVRGTPFNTGDVLELALNRLDAQAYGNWSGCHSTAWDAGSGVDPHQGHREASNEFTKSGYPLGLMLNVNGERFVDEGVDLRNYTYAKFGRAILAQPEHVAFQIWDSRTSGLLRSEEYRPERVEHITGNTIEELADACVEKGLRGRSTFIRTVSEYNAAVYAHRQENTSAKFDPAIRDGLSTQSSSKQLPLAKSNWAQPLDKGPFLAVKVTSGVTFTFGGLKVNPPTAQLLSATTGRPIPGLYCVGEMMGGLFYQNYPGGSGLTSGTVFGRRAGRAAAEAALKHGSDAPK
jgi:precorrin 3B synthase CobZ